METTTFSPEDLQAARELAEGATDTEDIRALREMVADDNNGETQIVVKGEDGKETPVSVTEIGSAQYAELHKDLGKKVVSALAVDSESTR